MAGESIEIEGILGVPSMLATEISDSWSRWKTDKKVFEDRIAENIAHVYATSTRETENAGSWDNSTTQPKLAHIYDNLKANYMDGLMPHNEWLNLESEENLSRERKNKILSYLRTKHRLRNLRGRVDELLDDWIFTGNCFSSVSYRRETSIDPITQATSTGYQGPEVTRISPYDIAFDLKASSFIKTPKIIRTVMTLGEIARELEENPGVRYDAEVMRQVLTTRHSLAQYSVDDINKVRQIELDGFGTAGQYYRSNQVEFLHFYGDIYDVEKAKLYKNHVITVVDRQLIARNEPLNTWTGRPHIFHSAWRKRPNNLWGQGPLDTLVGMQYRINHLENARADAFDEMLFGDLILTGDVEVRENEDGSHTYFVMDPKGGVTRLAPDATVLNADFQISQYEAKMDLYAGSPREAAGFRTPGEKTKFEVSRLENAASRIFQHKMTRFETDILEPTVNAELEVTRFHLDGRDNIKVITDQGLEDFVEITKDDLVFNGKIIPVGARHFARQAQLATDLQNFQNFALQDEEVKQHFPSLKLAEAWEKVLGAERFELLEAYGRIPERMQAQRKANVANQQLQEEEEAALSELEEEDG